MRARAVSVLACTLVFAGCSSDVQEPADRGKFVVASTGGDVSVVDVRRDKTHREATARVVGDGVDGVIRLGAIDDGPFTQGLAAALEDASGELLFSIELGWDVDQGRLWIRESTSTDYLVISMWSEDERVREEYNANGDVASFEYTTISTEAQRHAVKLYESGLPATGLPSDVREWIEQLGAFDVYYAPHATSTLHANPDGDLLVRILSEPGFAQFVIAGDEPDPQRTRMNQICSLAWACSVLKCQVGGLANPLCIACGGTSIACSIATFACSWIINCN